MFNYIFNWLSSIRSPLMSCQTRVFIICEVYFTTWWWWTKYVISYNQISLSYPNITWNITSLFLTFCPIWILMVCVIILNVIVENTPHYSQIYFFKYLYNIIKKLTFVSSAYWGDVSNEVEIFIYFLFGA